MNLDRRSFIIHNGKLLIVIGTMTYLNGCAISKGKKGMYLNRNEKLNTIINKEKMEILRYASLAPSGHNTQPWMVQILEPDHWILKIDKNRQLPAVDPENRELLLSFGAFIENLTIAAKFFGYQSHFEVLAKSPTDTDIVDIKLNKDTFTDFPLQKLEQRRTIRNGYLDEVIKKVDMDYFRKDFSDELFYFSNSSTAGKWLQDMTIEANKKQAFRDNAQNELANWIRWKDDQAEKLRDGLTPATMELTGIGGWFVKNFFNRDSVLSDSFKEKTVKIVKKQVTTCGGWIVITNKNSKISSLLDTGRKFERLFLKVKDRMIAIHPMTQILEESPWKEQVAGQLGIDGDIQFILRTGYVNKYPNPVSLRRDVNDFVSV